MSNLNLGHLGIGSRMVSPKDGMVMLYVPAGEFLMGSPEVGFFKRLFGEVYPDQIPQHKVYLDAYWIDQTPVTNRMFAQFVAETGYQTQPEKDGWAYQWNGLKWVKSQGVDWQHPRGPKSTLADKSDHPVVQVSWHDAQAYSQWAGRRLPTEAEWEKAARGVLTQEGSRIYPWGHAKPNDKLLNFDWNIKDTTPVGSYPTAASPYGALDMAGNVWEWTADWYDADYYKNSPSHQPQGPATGQYRVLRGGSWLNDAQGVRVAYRTRNEPARRSDSYGFRCVASV